jgi:hypothetical protein
MPKKPESTPAMMPMAANKSGDAVLIISVSLFTNCVELKFNTINRPVTE